MTPTEHCQTELHVPNDARAVGAVRGAIEHTSRHLGLPPEQEAALIATIEELLGEALGTLAGEEAVAVRISEHPNRIEIDLERPGAGHGEWAAARKLAGIDRVEEETGAVATRLRLVKLLPGAHPSHS
jgi:hypothetical protein